MEPSKNYSQSERRSGRQYPESNFTAVTSGVKNASASAASRPKADRPVSGRADESDTLAHG